MATTVRPLTIWNDQEAVLTGGRSIPHANALLFLPEGQDLQDVGRVVVFVHRWGGYHYDPLPRAIGPLLADRGVAFLSLALRRRGMEGQLTALPDDDLVDLKLAVDSVTGIGGKEIYLAGEGIGALSIARYAALRRDPRIAGLAFIRPGHEMPSSMERWLGANRYQAVVADAARAVRLGSGLDYLIDLAVPVRDGRSSPIVQLAAPWLAWWGPTADTRLNRTVERIQSPLLILGADDAWAATLRESSTASRSVTVDSAADDSAVAATLGDWIDARSPRRVTAPTTMEMVTVEIGGGSELLGFLWTPTGAPTDTALIYVHGIGALPLRPTPLIQAGAFAARGIATLAIELRRTGRGGQAIGVPEEDVEDIDSFVGYLAARGYRRIITCGASLGSISITLHQALRHHPAVVANVHLAPTAEGPAWARRGMGPERYDAAVERARAAVAEGRGNELLIDDEYRLPPPDPFHRPAKHFQRANSWLAWWGPDSINEHTRRIGDVDVPILLLSGTDDNYNDPARHAELEAAAVKAPSVRQKFYPGGNHSFEGLEYAVAQDIADWLADIGVYH